MSGVTEALHGAVLLDEDDEKLVVVGGERVSHNTTLLAACDAKGRFRLIDIDDVKDATYLAFRDAASAEAYLAEQKAGATEAEAA